MVPTYVDRRVTFKEDNGSVSEVSVQCVKVLEERGDNYLVTDIFAN